MSSVKNLPPVIPLTAAQFEALPPAVRKEALRKAADARKAMSWAVLGTVDPKSAALLQRVVAVIRETEDETRRELSEERIERLMSFYLNDEPLAQVDIDLERDNAALRAEYLRTVPTCTALDIRALQTGSLPRNPSDPAARWKREKRIFSIPHGGSDRFPAFQFVDGAPHPVLRQVLKALPEQLSTWQKALWFASANSWLDGRAPQEALNDAPELVAAAERLSEPAVG